MTVLSTNQRIMGSVTIRKAGRVIYSRTVGYRDSSAAGWVRIDTATLFRVGSVTKPFTAAMIYRLIEQGKLTLDDRLARFFPQLPGAAVITIRDLLAHTSGLADFTRGLDPRQPIGRSAILARVAAESLQFRPGAARRYSNTNFVLLGYIIESLTDATYAEQLKTLITAPAGLTRTRVGGPIAGPGNESRAYAFDEGRWVRQPDDEISMAGGGGSVISTTHDLTRFMSALFERRLISSSSLFQMTHGFDSGEYRGGKGLGPFEIPGTARLGFAHDGSIGAHTALVGYVPEDSLALAITINAHNYPINRVFFHVWGILYGTPEPLPSFTPVALGEALASRLVGTYTAAEYGLTIAIRRTAAGLEGQPTGQEPFALTYIGRHHFQYVRAGILIEFKLPSDGVASSFALFQQKGAIAFTRSAPAN